MNRVCLVGRLTKDPELRYSPAGTAVTRFTLAVERPYKQDNQPDADFIQVLTFKQTAEAVANYLKKGRLCSVEGRWQTGHFENNEGKRVYTNECLADNVRFLENNNKNNQQSNQSSNSSSDPFKDDGRPIDISDSDLPF